MLQTLIGVCRFLPESASSHETYELVVTRRRSAFMRCSVQPSVTGPRLLSMLCPRAYAGHGDGRTNHG